MAAVPACSRRDGAGVGTGLRLRDREGRNRAPVGDERQIAGRKAFIARGRDRIAAEPLHREYRVDQPTRRGEVLACQAQRTQVESGSTVLDWNQELAESALSAKADGVSPRGVDFARFATFAQWRSRARGSRERLLQLPVPLLEEWQIERRLRERQRSPFRAMKAS
jgi:hypothetical protein